MRVVFDTNIFVAALTLPSGSAARAIERIIAGHDRLLLSKPILTELLGVLARKFSHDSEELSRLALWLGDLAEWVQPRMRISVMADDPDNRILECALAGAANAVVTGDRALLALANFRGIALLSLRAYLSEST